MKQIMFRLAILGLFFCVKSTNAQIYEDFQGAKDSIVDDAVKFYRSYLDGFKGKSVPDYTLYWSKKECERYQTPDPIVYSIASSYPTYSMAVHKSIFYVRRLPEYVHIKTLLTYVDSFDNITTWAITNHYVGMDTSSGKLHFILPIDIDSSRYKAKVNGNVTYHFPVSHVFNKDCSDSLIAKVQNFEKEWGLEPIQFEYFFSENKDDVAAMRGLDYVYGMEDETPTGMGIPEERIIYYGGKGVGEDNFHEVLHLYLNPLYVESPINHGLIYYLGGGLGHDFDFFINRMNAYLIQNPDADLRNFEDLYSNDRMLHIDFTVAGLICKIIDEKEGVKGLKRLLTYEDWDALFEQEFDLDKSKWNNYLREKFVEYGSASDD